MKPTRRKTETAKSSDWFDASLIDRKPSRLSGAIFFMLCALLIFSTLAFGAVDSWVLGVLSGGAGLLAVLWLADSFLNKEFSFSDNRLQLPILGLILIGLIQLLPLRSVSIPVDLLSVEPVRTLTLNQTATRLAIVQLAVHFLFFAAALAYVNTQKRLRKFVLVTIVFGCAMAFFGIIQQLVSTDTIYGFRQIPNAFPFGSFVNRHHFASFMVMTVGLTLGLFYGGATKSDKRLLLIIAVVIMGMAVIMTASRGGILALLAVIAFSTFLNLTKKSGEKRDDGGERSGLKSKLLLVGGSLALVFVLVGMVLFVGGEAALQRGVGFQVTGGDISTGRFHFWQTTLHIIAANPILGAGLDAFGTAFPRYDTWTGALRVEQAHNDYLQILADGGILGFVCVAAFIFLLYKQGWAILNRTSDRFRRGVTAGALAGCFGILIHSFFDFPLRTPSNALFFLALVALAVNTINYPKLYKQHR